MPAQVINEKKDRPQMVDWACREDGKLTSPKCANHLSEAKEVRHGKQAASIAAILGRLR